MLLIFYGHSHILLTMLRRFLTLFFLVLLLNALNPFLKVLVFLLLVFHSFLITSYFILVARRCILFIFDYTIIYKYIIVYIYIFIDL